MSYAGPSRAHAPRSSAHASPPSPFPTSAGRSARSDAPVTYVPYSKGDAGWQQVAVFGAGLALGILLGVGGALLIAPRTGAETRAALSARAARLRRTTTRRSHDAWGELRDELRNAKLSLRRRKVRRSRELDDEA